MVLPALTAALLAGCGGSDEAPEVAPPATEGTPPPAETDHAHGNGEPLADASTEPVAGESPAAETALLTRVAIGRHEGFDRVVFEFRNEAPGYRVEYVEPPFREDGSGDPVEVQGSAFVTVRMELASGFDLSVAEGEQTYTGPRRLSGARAGAASVREVVRTGDFEGVLSWVIGLDERAAYRVLVLRDPHRLVVDFVTR